MRFGRIWIMRGPSIWSREPVIEAEFDLEDRADRRPADDIKTLPSIAYDAPSYAELLLRLTRHIQAATEFHGNRAAVHETRKPGHVRLVFDYDEDTLARACLETAFQWTEHLARNDTSFPSAEKIAHLRHLSHDIRLGPSTKGIVNAARARGIPVRRLTTGSLVQLGWAKNLRRIWTAETDQTPIIAETIAQDKDLTRKLLYDAGVPVPWGRPVSDADDAWAAALELGLPVVVKPRFGNQGRGVAANLTNEEQVRSAYATARGESAFVMVENYLPGRDHRILIVGGKLTAASLREPAQVVGDGRSTIASLVEEVNKDPRRSDGHATPQSIIKLDAIALGVLAEQGFTADSIPASAQLVLIRRNANLSTGGSAADVTDLVHPEIAQAAVEAARVVGLDIAGVDFIVEDVSKPWKAQGGGIVEVNAGPGLRMHLEPSAGMPRDVGAAIVESLFPKDDMSNPNGRIPVIAITGVNGKTTTSRIIAHLLRTAGLSVGLTCTDGIYLNGRRTETRDCSGPHSARSIFLNPRVEVAVLETARGGILREGLGFDRCDIGVVTNIGQGDHFGLRGIETLDELARVKRVVIEAVDSRGTGILNAADPLVAAMAEHCPGDVVMFARDEHEPALDAHRRKGLSAVFVRAGEIVLLHGAREETLLKIDEIPFLHHGVPFQIENALAAAAAMWRYGLSLDFVRAGLRTFGGDAEECPARFNVMEVGPSTVIVDYAHNPSAVSALIAGIEVFPHPRRTIVTSGSNRRDADLLDMGQMMGDAFDRVVLYADYGHSGRADGELNAVLKKGLAGGTRVRESHDAPDERQAIAAALQALQPGELLVLGVEAIEESLAFIRNELGKRVDRPI
jgi:cyanophycin synthetase